jgi:hypothetical protein
MGRRFTKTALCSKTRRSEKRLNHILMAIRMLTRLSQGETVDPAGMKDIEPVDQLEAALGKANPELIERRSTYSTFRGSSLCRGVRKALGKRPPEFY